MFACLPDVNECDVQSPCQHHCYNLIGSFLCQCDQGFELAADLVSCEGGHKNADIIEYSKFMFVRIHKKNTFMFLGIECHTILAICFVCACFA